MATDYLAEQWKSVNGFPAYEISNLGRLRRKPGLNGGHAGLVTHVQVCPKGGYLQYRMRLNTKKTARYIHRLVAEHFVDGWMPDLHVHHKDGDITNNTAENLQWLSKQEHDKRHFEEKEPAAGLRFGRWTVIERIPLSRGLCRVRCNCGREYKRAMGALKRGSTHECFVCSNQRKALLPKRPRKAKLIAAGSR